MSERGYGFFWGFFFLFLMPAILVILFFPDLVSRSQFSSPYSTFRSDPQGSKALFLFGQEIGYAPKRITQPVYQNLGPGLLFSFNPHNFSPKEKIDTLDWIHRGGTYVLATDQPHPLLDVFSLSFSWNKGRAIDALTPKPGLNPELEPCPKPGSYPPRQGRRDPLTAGLSLFFEPISPHLRQKRGNFFSLFEDRAGPLVVLIHYGKGQLVVLGDSRFFGNQNLTKGDNLTFISRLMYLYGSENLYFDEYHHGFTNDLSIPGYLWKRSFQFFFCQLLLIVLSWVYLQRKAWGERRPEPAADPEMVTASRLRPSSDSIKAIARIYQRVGLVPETIQWLYEALAPTYSGRPGRHGSILANANDPQGDLMRAELEREKAKLIIGRVSKGGKGDRGTNEHTGNKEVKGGKVKIQAAEAVRFTQKLVNYRKGVYRKEVYGRAQHRKGAPPDGQSKTGH